MYNLIINYQDRDLDFQFKGQKNICGRGLKNLISKIGSKEKVDRIDINGESGPYTFSRQVYLLVNLLASLNKSVVYINGSKQEQDQVTIPSYN